MTENFGTDWWDSNVPNTIKNEVTTKQRNESDSTIMEEQYKIH